MVNDSSGLPSRPVFGVQVPGREYQPRPGAYAIILDEHSKVAVIEVRGSYFLPGGGINPGENAQEALHREVIEEVGWTVEIGRLIGEAVDYIAVEESGSFYEIQSSFFRAEFQEEVGSSKGPDHHLVWLPVKEAFVGMRRQSQAWAVGLFLT